MTTRREFVQIAGVSAAALGISPGAIGGITGGPDRNMEHGKPLTELEYSQVTLEPGPQRAQFEQTHAVIMNISDDDLLKVYRRRASLPAPGCGPGGWYDSDWVGGANIGWWISALSRNYAITGSEAVRTKVDRLVRGLADTMQPSAKGYPQQYPKGEVCYNYDKLVGALIDAHQYTKQPTALQTLALATDAALPVMPGRAIDCFDKDYDGDEHFELPELQFLAWQRGAGPRHLQMARQYLLEKFYDALARGDNVLKGRHAWSHMNALNSAAKAYLVLGDTKYLDAAKQGFEFVEQQSFATGAWGPLEHFLPRRGDAGIGPINTLSDSLTMTHCHFETGCGSYAHFKLTRYLLRLTKESRYGDSMERIMLNTVLGAKPLLPDGRSFYYSDYHPDGHQSYFDGNGGIVSAEWPCCSGSLPVVSADYWINTYFTDNDGIYVNLYVPSSVRWQHRGTRITLGQSGSYPLDDVVTLSVSAPEPVEFALRVRIPAWARQAAIEINGRPFRGELRSGSFAVLKREWRAGDEVQLTFHRTVELKAIDEHDPDMVAVVYGPLVLFAATPVTPKVTRAQLLAAKQLASKTPEWQVETEAGTLRLKPFWAIKSDGGSYYASERYSTYLRVS